jgi:hypothetical protein
MKFGIATIEAIAVQLTIKNNLEQVIILLLVSTM